MNQNHLDGIAIELADQFLSGNIIDVIERIEVWKPMQAAYLAYKIGILLPSCYHSSFERALARRV